MNIFTSAVLGRPAFARAAIALAAIGLFAAPANAEPLTNQDVVSLLEAGLGDEAVIAKIETSEGEYETSTDTLLALRAKGVSSPVIAAMVKRASAPAAMSDSSADPLVPHFPGVYMFDDWSDEPRMWKIDPTSTNQTKTGGILGYALTGGIASASVKAVIPGEAARYTAQSNKPVFYAYFGDKSDGSGGTFSSGFSASVQSPNEFSLVKLKEKKGRREARVGSVNIGGAKAGVMDKDQIAFTYEQISPGVFKFQPDATLEEGQYGFVFAISGGAGPGLTGGAGNGGARVFAFGVTE